MDNLIFCLNATVPIFLTMVLGFFFRKIGLMDEKFVPKLNRFVFRAALPLMLFENMWLSDFGDLWDGKFLAFCIIGTTCSAILCVLLSFLLKDKRIRGEFAQGAYRSNAAILGLAFIENIYGHAGIASLMLVGTVPFYNVYAVIILSFLKPDRAPFSKKLLADTVKGIFKNPLIIGIVVGALFSVLHVPQVPIVTKTVHNLSILATPLGLMVIGASFEGKKALAMIKPTLACSFVRLVGLSAIIVPIGILFGFRDEAIISILIMSGSSTAISSFIMSKNMGHDGTLTSSVVMLTTLCSAFTLTTWLFILRSMGFV